MNIKHLKIQKGEFLDLYTVKPYKVTTYYDYTINFYFDTRKSAQEFVNHNKKMDKFYQETA